MTWPPDESSDHSTTARPAEKGASGTGPDPALVRRTVTALCDLAASTGRPMRRSSAREVVLNQLGIGRSADGILRGARNEWGVIDEPGATAARNLDRHDWAAAARAREKGRSA